MPWAAAIPIAMAAIGAIQAKRKADAEQNADRRNAMANASMMEYSPWTGMNPGLHQASGHDAGGAALGGAAQGAASGMMFGQQFNKPQQNQQMTNEEKMQMSNSLYAGRTNPRYSTYAEPQYQRRSPYGSPYTMMG